MSKVIDAEDLKKISLSKLRSSELLLANDHEDAFHLIGCAIEVASLD